MSDPNDTDAAFMRLALDEARAAESRGEVPIGAVLVREGEVVARAHNAPIGRSDPTAHAEMLVLREAGRALGAPRLPGTTLFVTLEPCLMCLGGMIHARVARLVYGAEDAKLGAARFVAGLPLGPDGINHRIEIVGGVLAGECAGLLRGFFRDRRP